MWESKSSFRGVRSNQSSVCLLYLFPRRPPQFPKWMEVMKSPDQFNFPKTLCHQRAKVEGNESEVMSYLFGYCCQLTKNMYCVNYLRRIEICKQIHFREWKDSEFTAQCEHLCVNTFTHSKISCSHSYMKIPQNVWTKFLLNSKGWLPSTKLKPLSPIIFQAKE